MTDKLYYKNTLVTEEDYSEMAETFKLTYDMVSEVLAQISVNGEPTYAQYMGTARERVRELAQAIKVAPDSAVSVSTEPAETTAEDKLIDGAAISLMGAIANSEDGSFIVTPEGICTVNPDHPPELIQAYQVVGNVLRLKDVGSRMDDKSSWMLGSIVAELENYFGEDFESSQVARVDTRSYNTIYTAVAVYKAFKNKRYKLSFTHHKEAFYSKITDEAKALILRKAESHSLTAKDVRALGSIVKKMDGDTTLIQNISSQEAGKDLIAAYKDNKVGYLVLNNNEMTEIKGEATSIPTGRLVIDLKNKTWRKDNGEPIKIKKAKKNK